MENELRLYANAAAFSEEIRSNLEADGVKIYPYDDVYSYVQTISSDKKVLLSRANVNSRLVSNIPSEVTILDEPNLTLLPKAVKNKTEMENERIAHIKDGIAVTKFIHWLKKNVTRTTITELSAAEKLYQFRSEQEHFLGTVLIRSLHMERMLRSYITARQKRQTSRLRPGNGACRYRRTLSGRNNRYHKNHCSWTCHSQRKEIFTAVLRGNLNLAAAKFKYGCTGLNLDYLARGPLWELGEDYNHGTGHGVGYLLNVHEGPNSFRWKNLPGNPAPVLEEGMITSDEPGYYLENEFGIRHENLVLCKRQKRHLSGSLCASNH